MVDNPEVGVIGYGVALPARKLDTGSLVRLREGQKQNLKELIEKVQNGLGLNNKMIAGPGEDTITFATEAAENAVKMSGINPSAIDSVLAGSESKPYAVGQIARHAASFIGAGNRVLSLDTEAACNPTFENLFLAYCAIAARKIDFALVIGADVSQAPKGDPLEYAAGAGAGAFVVGWENPVASIIDFSYYSTLTPDFWRREGQPVPKHFGRTTVEAYISHVIGAIQNMMDSHPEITLSDFDYITFHQPSAYMPLKTAKIFSGLDEKMKAEDVLQDTRHLDRMKLTREEIDEKIKPTLVVPETGNTYAAATSIATVKTFDMSKPGQNILAVSYGSGAHTTAAWFRVEEEIKKKRGSVPSYQDYLNRRISITIPEYLALQGRKTFGIDFPRYVGTIEPIPASGEIYESFCDECKSIYYPAREKCLNPDDRQPLIQKTFPKLGALKSSRKLPKIDRIIAYDILSNHEVALVSSKDGDLTTGSEVEYTLKRIYAHGATGIIIYAMAYQPKFRTNFRAFRKELSESLYQPIVPAMSAMTTSSLETRN